MSTPRVTEIPGRRPRIERDDFADSYDRSTDREPHRRMAPYDRAAERAMIRASLLAIDMHTHAYDRESTR
jgi:hypothetical protein